jgi:hypothetical protein
MVLLTVANKELADEDGEGSKQISGNEHTLSVG